MSRYLGEDYILPALDPNNSAWFTAGQLMVQFCADCNASRFPPEDVCFSCRGCNLEFRSIEGFGRIESVVEVQHPVHPALADRVPYNVAVVSLDAAPGCNAIGNIVNAGQRLPAIGDAVKAIFETVTVTQTGEELKIPNWELI